MALIISKLKQIQKIQSVDFHRLITEKLRKSMDFSKKKIKDISKKSSKSKTFAVIFRLF